MSASTPAIRTGTDRVVVGLLLSCGAALAMAAGGLGRWLGVLMLLGGVWELRYVVPRPPIRIRGVLPVAVLLAAYVSLFWELLLGRPPGTRDHGIHYFQTRLLWDEFIPTGRLWGWSDALGAGYPFGESYPVLGYVLGGLPHALSLGFIGPRASYALGIAITWGLGAIAVGWLAHAIVSALRGGNGLAPRWAFCAGGLLWLFDAGASRQGGWNYLMFHGVWPQMFSAVLWALSLTLTLRALRHPSPRRIAAAALVLGASVMAHPFGMLAAAASAGLMLVVVLISPQDMPAPLRTWALIHAWAVAACLGVVLVFFGSAGAMARSPVQWSPLGQLSYEAITGDLFSTHWAWQGPLCILGVIAVVRRPVAAGSLALLLCGSLIVLGSHESMTVLRLDLLVSGFKNLQFPRYTIELKPVLFALGGVGAGLLPPAVRSLRATPSRAHAWLFAAVLTPFAATLAADVGRLQTRPVGALDTLESNEEGELEAGLLKALRAEAAAHEGPLKVAYLRAGMGGAMFPLFSITDAGAAMVLDGHIAAVNFEHRIRREALGYDALGVTHVIHDRPLRDDEAFASRLERVARFGRFRLARYRPKQTRPRVTASGGEATLAVDEREHIVVDVEASGNARVILRQAPHLRWQARFEGEPVEIDALRQVPGLHLLGVDVEGSGRLELTYHRAPAERIGGWISLLAWVAGLGALIAGRPLPWRSRARPAALVPVALVLGLVGLGIAFDIQQTKLEDTWRHFAAERAYRGAPLPEDEALDTERPRLVRDLIDEGAYAFTRDPARVCDGLSGKDVLSGCSETEHAPVRATTYRKPYLYRCVEFGVPPGGAVKIRLGSGKHDVLGRLTRRLLGAPGRGLTFDVSAQPKPRKLGADVFDFVVRSDEKGEPAYAVLRNDGRHIERFCLAAAEVAPPQSELE